MTHNHINRDVLWSCCSDYATLADRRRMRCHRWRHFSHASNMPITGAVHTAHCTSHCVVRRNRLKLNRPCVSQTPTLGHQVLWRRSTSSLCCNDHTSDPSNLRLELSRLQANCSMIHNFHAFKLIIFLYLTVVMLIAVELPVSSHLARHLSLFALLQTRHACSDLVRFNEQRH